MNYEKKYNELVESVIDVLTYDIDSEYAEEAHNGLLHDLCKERGYELNDEQRIMTCDGCDEYIVTKNATRDPVEGWMVCSCGEAWEWTEDWPAEE
ncbi:MAG TPA: hypothetical protein DHN29_01360 [Cytophagales bacterium]|nr:hypothetical protein [Cytophagales bacterium]|tara:strand:+ start:1266 stop:1550 length:285 start_codon:yes stop_codon:yes gene_type:complete